jgi:hypothetical protein
MSGLAARASGGVSVAKQTYVLQSESKPQGASGRIDWNSATSIQKWFRR